MWYQKFVCVCVVCEGNVADFQKFDEAPNRGENSGVKVKDATKKGHTNEDGGKIYRNKFCRSVLKRVRFIANYFTESN